MMTQITYREFYDVPRMVILNHRGLKLLLDSGFDESKDEYSLTYKTYILPMELDERTQRSWAALPQTATKCIGEIPVDQVIFDPTKRAEIDTRLIDKLLDSARIL